MERKTGILLASIVLSVLSLAGVAVMRLASGSGPGDAKQLTQEQRLNALDSLAPRSATVRNMVRGEKANEQAVKDFEHMVHAYWGTILSVDDSVGRLFRFLEDAKQLDNTIIVFMGDNGLLQGEHGMVDKRTMHEPSIRIPLIARGKPNGV